MYTNNKKIDIIIIIIIFISFTLPIILPLFKKNTKSTYNENNYISLLDDKDKMISLLEKEIETKNKIISTLEKMNETKENTKSEKEIDKK